MLYQVEIWAARAHTIDPVIRHEVLALLHLIPAVLATRPHAPGPMPAPLAHPEDEGPKEILEQVLALLQAGVRPAEPRGALQRICRRLHRHVERMPEAPSMPRSREPQLRAGALMGVHRPTSDFPTAREKLRAGLDQDPWDSD